MTALGPALLARQFALELDVLRGIAAILMVVNHAGYRLLSSDDAVHSAVAPVVFLGSAAPAVFFFATGFGIGLSRSTPPRAFDWLGLLWKAALLIVADQFFYWSRGARFGLDFFSFIAIATITVSLLSRLRYAIEISVFLGAALLVLRYGLAPSLGATDHPIAFVEWLLGVRTVSDVSSGVFALITGCLIAACFFCSNKFASVVSTLTMAKHPRALFCTLIGLVSALCIGLNFEHLRAAVPTVLVTLLAQLAVAV